MVLRVSVSKGALLQVAPWTVHGDTHCSLVTPDTWEDWWGAFREQFWGGKGLEGLGVSRGA
jgi:hypothetical protein